MTYLIQARSIRNQWQNFAGTFLISSNNLKFCKLCVVVRVILVICDCALCLFLMKP